MSAYKIRPKPFEEHILTSNLQHSKKLGRLLPLPCEKKYILEDISPEHSSCKLEQSPYAGLDWSSDSNTLFTADKIVMFTLHVGGKYRQQNRKTKFINLVSGKRIGLVKDKEYKHPLATYHIPTFISLPFEYCINI